MKKFLSTCITLFAATTLATAAFADPKPKGAKTMEPQLVANMYAGKTVQWAECKGGIYYGAKFEAQSYCNKKNPAFGLGKWTVDRRGHICHQVTYYWKDGKGYGSAPQDKKVDCIAHLVTKDGTIWRNWTGQKDWWRLNPSDLKRGFKFKRQVNTMRRKFGV